jgi:glycyl-tRNA synthetase beta subunit
MRDLGVTDVKVVKISTQEDYLQRLHRAYVATDDAKLKKFIFNEIKKIMIQRGEW